MHFPRSGTFFLTIEDVVWSSISVLLFQLLHVLCALYLDWSFMYICRLRNVHIPDSRRGIKMLVYDFTLYIFDFSVAAQSGHGPCVRLLPGDQRSSAGPDRSCKEWQWEGGQGVCSGLPWTRQQADWGTYFLNYLNPNAIITNIILSCHYFWGNL